ANRAYVLFTVKYASDYGEVLVALNAATGAVAWTFNQTTRWTSGSPTGMRSAPLLIGSLVIFGSQDGSVYAVNAATGALSWWFPTGTPVETVPAAEGTIVYVTSGTELHFLDINGLTDGDAGPAEGGGWTGDEIVLPVNVGVGIEASPVVADPYVYVAAGGDLWALNRVFGGPPVWSSTTTWGSVGTPAIIGDTIVVRRSDDRVYAFDRTTGQILWVRGGMMATGEADAAAADGRVFLTATTTSGVALVTFDATDGRIVHQASLPSGPLGAPVAASDLVIVSSGSELLAFRGQPDLAALSTDVVLNAEQASNGVARGNLTIAIRNMGDEPAVGARVRVYDGSPGPTTLIADFLVGKAIKAGGRSEGNVTATRDWSVGRHEVWVVVDPVPSEENTANNQALVILYVEPGQPKTIVVGGGPTYLALILGVLIGAAVLYIPLRRLRGVRRKEEETPTKP
ncbi:MAG TPA: PQQ-binding-like beta-propeller repeat protein, partial [Thermoplasmata archaeon]|nr:PQQ-binding-like beta-propeller repeat protein [Thermoplasmata archaeon]